MEFTQDDHDALRRIEESADRLERGQAQMLRAQARIPARTARRVSVTMSKRAAILIGIGVLVGSALGNASAAAVRDLALKLMGIH